MECWGVPRINIKASLAHPLNARHQDGGVSFADLCEYDCLVASGQVELVSRLNWGCYPMEAVEREKCGTYVFPGVGRRV